MPGTAANPVVLDPFRTLTEVGWNTVPKYIVIRTAIEIVALSYGEGDACPVPTYDEFGNPIDPDWPYEGQSGAWATAYLLSWKIEILPDEETGLAYARQATGIWKNKTETLQVGTGEHPVTITGLTVETLAEGSHSDWEYKFAGAGGTPDYIAKIDKPTAEEVEDPDYLELFSDFYRVTSLDVRMLAHAISSGAGQCGILNRGTDQETWQTKQTAVSATSATNANYDIAFAAADEVDVGALVLSGITVEYRGATYKPIGYQHFGAGLIQSPEGHEYFHGRYTTEDPYGEFNDEFTVAILCERDEGTA